VSGPTGLGIQQQQLLLGVHAHLREELDQLRRTVEQVEAGAGSVASARHHLNTMAMRQNYWTLGAFFAAYCRVVATHHTIEDQAWFPALRDAEPDLAPVIDRLEAEHVSIAALLDTMDAALVAMVTDPTGVAEVRRVIDELSRALLSHLEYEESQLLDAIGRHALEG
jgi:iron-sulfur cluster repair protein YtfE (RIC family)